MLNDRLLDLGKRAELALRESREQFEALLNQAPIGVYLVDSDFIIRQVNPVALPVFGGVTGGPIGRNFDEVIHILWDKDYADEVVRIFRHTLETGEPYVTPERAEYRVDRGITEYYEWRLDRILLSGGQPGVVCYFRDISVQVNARKEIEESRERAGQNETRYHTLFDAIDSGFCVIEMIFGECDRAVDYRFIEANRAFERQSGLVDAVGRLISEFAPDLEAHWFERYGRIALTGESLRVEGEVAPLGRWFDINAFRVGAPEQRRVAVLFTDITARRNAEIAVREGTERQRFLLKLSDALRPLGEPSAIQVKAMCVLGEHVAVSRAQYHEVEPNNEWVTPGGGYSEGVALHHSRLRIDDFGVFTKDAYDGGRTLVITDTETDPRITTAEREAWVGIGVRACVAVPLVKDGRFVAVLGLDHATPRAWSPLEIELAEEVAERTWAGVERAQAEAELRSSESRLRAMFDSVDQGYMEVEVEMSPEGRATDWRYVALNPSFHRLTGMEDVAGRLASDVFPDREPEWAERYAQVVTTGEPLRFELPAAAIGRWFDINLVKVGGAGSRRIAVVYDDVTDRKRVEAVLRENQARQAFLLELSDSLRAEPSAEAVADRAVRMLYDQLGLDRCYIGIYRLAEDIALFPHQVHDDRLLPLPAQVRLSDFPESLQIVSSRTLVVDDVMEMEGLSDSDRAGFDGLGIRALIVATLRKGENTPLWAIVAASACARVWSPGETALVEEVAERAWAAAERARASAALRDSEARFRQFSDASTDVLWIRDVKTLRMVFASPAFDTVYGIFGPDKGGGDSLLTWARLVEPEFRSGVLSNFRSLRNGERVEHEFRIRRASDGALRWIHNSDFPLFDGAGDVRWVAGIGADITDAQAYAGRQEILVAELQHRTRNLIAVVGALAERTVQSATSLKDFNTRFSVRLSALSRVQGLLSDLTIGERVTFDELLKSELAAHGFTDGLTKQITLSGPKGVPLRSGTVQTFALALHELATNAVKYGALASPQGRLAVTWRVEPGIDSQPPTLHLKWRETGVVLPVRDPATIRRGYGREMIERALPYQLGARTSYELKADGVSCTIAVQISKSAFTGSADHE